MLISKCGRGDSEEIIKSYAAKDERIVFRSIIKYRSGQAQGATVLVNPRQNNESLLNTIPVEEYGVSINR